MTNAELLAKIKAEIDKRYAEYREKMKSDDFTYYEGMADALDLFEQFIDSLESEKPINLDDAMKELDEKIALVKERGTWDGVDVDKYMDEVRGREPEKPMELEEEVKRYYSDNFEYISSDQPTLSILTNIARHFAEWGYLRAAEKYNEIEYNRQRAEEPVSDDLEEMAVDIADALLSKPKDYVLSAKADYWNGAHDGIIAGAKWMKEQDEKEQADLFTIVALDAAQRAREQMMKDGIEGEICHLGVDFLDYNISELDEYIKRFKVGDKIRIIIVKED